MAAKRAEPGRSPGGDPSPPAPGLLDQPPPTGGGATAPVQEEETSVSQEPANLTKPTHATSGSKRVATRDLVRIGQRWRRRSRRKAERHEVVIRQIHRGDRSVDAWIDGGTGHTLVRISFHVLRDKYVLLDKPDEGGKGD